MRLTATALAALTLGTSRAIGDLPPEEDDELCLPANAAGLNFIRLATPTTDDRRLPKVLQNTSGFVYYVSITGITGAAEAEAGDVGPEVARIKSATDLPVIVGFGIKTPEAAEHIDMASRRRRSSLTDARKAFTSASSPPTSQITTSGSSSPSSLSSQGRTPSTK